MNRRGFLQSILATGVAPAVVGSGILMPIKKLWTPPAFDIGKYDVWVNTGTEITATEIQQTTVEFMKHLLENLYDNNALLAAYRGGMNASSKSK